MGRRCNFPAQQQIGFCRSADGTQLAYALSGEGPPLVKVASFLTPSSTTGAARWCSRSSETVRNHITRIFEKLQVETRAQAIVRAREAGLGRA